MLKCLFSGMLICSHEAITLKEGLGTTTKPTSFAFVCTFMPEHSPKPLLICINTT